MEIIKQIKNFVEEECKKPTSKYGSEPFEFHFLPTVEYAEKLADKLGGDKEVILISAWLHDIGSIIYGRENHHITSMKIAEMKLKELDYPLEKIELVKKCILNHRGSQENKRETIEEQIVAEADAMNSFDNLSGNFKAAFVYENLTQGEAKNTVREKLKRKYKQLHFKESKEIIKPKFEAILLLLK
jgi:uncharacterized protein